MCRNTGTPAYTFNLAAARICRRLGQLYTMAQTFDDPDDFRNALTNLTPNNWLRFRINAFRELVDAEALFDYEGLSQLFEEIEEALMFEVRRNAAGHWIVVDIQAILP